MTDDWLQRLRAAGVTDEEIADYVATLERMNAFVAAGRPWHEAGGFRIPQDRVALISRIWNEWFRELPEHVKQTTYQVWEGLLPGAALQLEMESGVDED